MIHARRQVRIDMTCKVLHSHKADSARSGIAWSTGGSSARWCHHISWVFKHAMLRLCAVATDKLNVHLET